MFSSNSSQVSSAVTYIEDVFSTYLYTGTGATQTITNGIDLSTKGGLTWSKDRSAARTNSLIDTVRGATFEITSDDAGQQTTESNGLNQFNSNGYRIGPANNVNASGENFVSWTFREQAKFFDVLTYTGTGSNTTIAHNLGAVPGCIMVKRTTTYGYDWAVYHRSLANTQYLVLNTTATAATGATWWNSTTATSSVFSLGTDASVNASGATYVAYLFAHDSAGFGLAGTDNVISCGGYTGDETSNRAITLGYEPQWILWKNATNASGLSETNWQIYDTMRGWLGNATGTGGDSKWLQPNTSSAEGGENAIAITPTGIAVGRTSGSLTNRSGDTYIYIAIRRGPMKVPSTGSSVFSPIARTGTGANATVTSVGFPVDLLMSTARNGNDAESWWDRLRNTGGAGRLLPSSTSAEIAGSTDSLTGLDVMDGFKVGVDTNGRINYSPWTYVYHCFRRAPGFFDEVCVTTSGYEVTATHNLGVSPELIIGKARNQTGSWVVWASAVAALNVNNTLILNTTAAATNNGMPINTVTATSFYAAIAGVAVETEVFYLFATCAGVSKVGSYTGNGTTQTIDCGFTGGARFVLIKRTDSTGDWYTYDTARGMTVLTDPYLLLNTTAAEVATLGSVTTVSTGFALNSAILAAINVSAGSYIFLAVA